MSQARGPTEDAPVGDETRSGCETSVPGRGLREARVSISSSDFEAIGLEGLVSLWSDAGLRSVEAVGCHGRGAVVEVEVERPLDADRLASLERVDRWEHLCEAGAPERYVVEFTAPRFPPSLADRRADLLGTCDPELDEHGITTSLVGPQRAIAEVVGEYEAVGVSPDLRRLGSYRGHERPMDALTERQREVLRTAHGMGYYDVPRDVSAEDVAAELGIDGSTVVEHLQRAERNLLGHHLP